MNEKTQQRKPAKRAFTGLAGSPIPVEPKHTQPTPAPAIAAEPVFPTALRVVVLDECRFRIKNGKGVLGEVEGTPQEIRYAVWSLRRDGLPIFNLKPAEIYCREHRRYSCPCADEYSDWAWPGQTDADRERVTILNNLLKAELKRAAEEVMATQNAAAEAERNPEAEAAAWKLSLSYDPEKFRKAIDIGLRHAKRVLRDFSSFKDLKQIVELEVWRASIKYGAGMNEALACTIAKNQGQKFLARRIREQTTEEGARRFLYLDLPAKDDEGKQKDISLAEKEVQNQRPPNLWAPDTILDEAPAELQALVNSWHGAKRAVGEALLNSPDPEEITVRDIPGVPKSTAARVLRVVLEEFRRAKKGWPNA